MMDFELVGCEMFGYDSHFRPVGQVGLHVESDGEVECLHAIDRLPKTTVQAQVVMFLQLGDVPLKLYSAMLPVKDGVVDGTIVVYGGNHDKK